MPSEFDRRLCHPQPNEFASHVQEYLLSLHYTVSFGVHRALGGGFSGEILSPAGGSGRASNGYFVTGDSSPDIVRECNGQAGGRNRTSPN